MKQDMLTPLIFSNKKIFSFKPKINDPKSICDVTIKEIAEIFSEILLRKSSISLIVELLLRSISLIEISFNNKELFQRVKKKHDVV